MKKRGLKINRTPAEKKKDESLILNDFENYLAQDYAHEIAENKKAKEKIKRSARYYLKKGNKKKFEAKMRSLSHFNENEEKINEAYGIKQPEKRRERKIELTENNFDTFFADFEYSQRKELIDYVFNNAELKTYQKQKLSKIMDSLIKKIDRLLSEISYSQLIIVESKKTDIQDIYLFSKKKFENL